LEAARAEDQDPVRAESPPEARDPYTELRASWPRPWPDDDEADRRAFAMACRQGVAPEIILAAAIAWAKAVDEPKFLPSLAKWLDRRGWEKAPPQRRHAPRAKEARGRYRTNGTKPDMARIMFEQAGWTKNADGSLTDPDSGRTWGAVQ
jgi:hypothetical protein